MITKGERAELRSLLRARFKLLRNEVDQREAELLAELTTNIRERFADQDKAYADAGFLIAEAARAANRQANDIVRALRPDWVEREIISYRPLGVPRDEHHKLTQEGQARIAATVRAAKLTLDQQEMDLLTRLATGALESDEARAFLGEIPTVSALVPAVRLLELEQSLRETNTHTDSGGWGVS